jgi:hypothetical protein
MPSSSSRPKECYFFWCKCKTAAWSSITSRYLAACAVYFAYSVGMVLADDPNLNSAKRNDYYFKFGIVHLINACMFVWTWEGKSYTDKVVIPEYLNVLGAVLYLWSRLYINMKYVLAYVYSSVNNITLCACLIAPTTDQSTCQMMMAPGIHRPFTSSDNWSSGLLLLKCLLPLDGSTLGMWATSR